VDEKKRGGSKQNKKTLFSPYVGKTKSIKESINDLYSFHAFEIKTSSNKMN
jgi:hypothetical protein